MTIYQKSVYLIVFNATMILRKLGLNEEDRKKFKKQVFAKLENLTQKIDNETLTEYDIRNAIRELSEEFNISFGQAQKPINVILKYHFFLTRDNNSPVKKKLDCPLDSIILKKLNRSGYRLKSIDEQVYIELQNEIYSKTNRCRIDFDIEWDIQNLRDEGLLDE